LKRLVFGSPGKTRTCNLLVNSQTLLPIELPGNNLFSQNMSLPKSKLPNMALSLQPIPFQGDQEQVLINKHQNASLVKGFKGQALNPSLPKA
jgi:hypothetical protein